MSLGFAVSVELLCRKSSRDGGLAFYSNSDEIPISVFIAYNYVSTVLATLFSILWTIIDLDTKRIEPYTQISGSHSHPFPLSVMLLDYAFEHPWQVPLLACKRRHWSVAVTSTMFLLISIFLAPTQSALLGLKTISKSHDVAITAWPDLPSRKDQALFFTSEAVNQAHAVFVNHANPPPFTTEKYAISPLGNLTRQGGNEEIWSLQARVYWSDIECVDVPEFHLASEPKNVDLETATLAWVTENIPIPTEASSSTPCQPAEWNTYVVAERSGPGTYAVFDRIYDSNAEMRIGPTNAVQDTNCIEFPFMTALFALNASPGDVSKASNFSYNATAIAAICKASYSSALGNVSLRANGSVLEVDLSKEVQTLKLSRDTMDIDNLEDSISNANRIEEEPSSLDPMHTFFAVNPVTMSSVVQATLSILAP